MDARPTRNRLRCRPALAALLAGFMCGGVAGADWPQFLGPTRNGVSSETGLATSWPAQGPPVLWSREVGPGYSGPVVAGDRLILFHRLGNEEVVECLDAATGKGHWKTAYPTAYQDAYGKGDGPRSTPLVADRRVYTLGAEGTLHCLDLDTGKVIWKRTLAEDYTVPKNFFGVGTSPLLEGDLLLINVGGKDAGIVAFARETGKEVWRATDQGASYSSPVAATINGTRHVFFWTRAGLVSLDPGKGAVRFSWPWRSRIAASVNAAMPVVVGDQLCLSACYGVGAVLLRVRPDGVDEVWKTDALSNHYDTSIQAGGYLYGVDGRQDVPPKPSLRCVELKTGKLRWTRERFGCASAVLAEGRLFVLTEDGDLVLIEATPDAYQEKARAHVLSKPCRAAIALAGGRLYGRDAQHVVCWNLNR
jgi:outer membrane protein assembly factor BamB